VSHREQEAAAWFARMRGPDADRHRAAFESWRGDPDNAAAYAIAEEDWLMVGGVAPAPVGAHRPATLGRRPVPKQWAMAAALFLALTLGLGWYLQVRPEGSRRAETITTPGQTRLADGSEVVLTDGATIAVDFTGAARHVTLTGGHARFSVAHDAGRPFTVFAGGSETTALGTIFEVDLRQPRPRIRLIEGSVEVRGSGKGRALRLGPGESAEVEGADARRIPTMASPVTTTMLDADNLPLGAVIERANRSNSIPIELADPALAARRLSGRFDTADRGALARKLAAALDLTLVSGADAHHLMVEPKKTGG
jgi:transmembrane sensor